jgi:hypothetical protein
MDDLPPPQPSTTITSGLPLSGGAGAEPLPCGPQPATSLDHLETSVRERVESFLNEQPAAPVVGLSLDESTSSIRFRHSGWQPIRRKIFESLRRTQQSASRISSFCSCGCGAWLQVTTDAKDLKQYRISGSFCHDRFCTPCANTRSMRIKEALLRQMPTRGVSFITLTLQGKDQSLTDLVDRLFRHFRALRTHPFWSESVRGGAAFIEIKWSDRGRRWHPHLHIIADADFMDQGKLSEVWRGISKDSYIVDIRRVRDPEVTGRYVTKYASKPLNPTFLSSPPLLDEAIKALAGRRLCLCFGTWYGTKLSSSEDEELADDGDLTQAHGWTNLLPLHDLLDRANHGDQWCIDVIRASGAEARWRQMLLSPDPTKSE